MWLFLPVCDLCPNDDNNFGTYVFQSSAHLTKAFREIGLHLVQD